MKAFFVRLISGIVLLAIIIAAGILGGDVLYALTLAISLIGYEEFLKVFQLQRKAPGVWGMVFLAFYYVGLRQWDLDEFALFFLIAYLLILMAVYVFTFPKYKTEEIAEAFLGFVYVPVMLSFIWQTRMLPIEGESTSLIYFLIFICSWGCDTCAYAVGMLIGKHKLAPVLSPKKSIEGAVGGVAGAALIGFLYAGFFSLDQPECALLCAIGAVVSQVGDLAATAIKRNHGIKDYGRLIPGHGGILDRFDSVIVTAPIIYILAVIFLK